MRSTLLNSALVFLLLVSLTQVGTSQQGPAGSAEQRPSSPKSLPNSASDQQLTHVSNQAAGHSTEQKGIGDQSQRTKEPEDEEAVFKYSPAVRGIARITGLSLTSAYWACVVINFAVIALLIFFALKSNVPAMLRGRTQEIQRGMEEALQASEDAGRRLREVEARLSRLSVEIEEMQKHADAEAKAEEDRIHASIDEEKSKIIQAAEQEVALAANSARRDLQKYAVELAVAVAEKGIRVDTSTDKALVEEFTEQLGGDARRNGST